VWLVTARLDEATVRAVATLAAARREVAIVHVVAASWAGARALPPQRAELDQLAVVGVPVSRVVRGDDLARALAHPIDARDADAALA
jgi:hypothetical protein